MVERWSIMRDRENSPNYSQALVDTIVDACFIRRLRPDRRGPEKSVSPP